MQRNRLKKGRPGPLTLSRKLFEMTMQGLALDRYQG